MKFIIKDIFDFFMAFTGMIILLPVFVIIFLTVLFTMGWPVFFIQKRVGKNADLFRIIKFRTMTKNNQKSTVSIKGDARITKTGAFLRKYKLDELPEIFNILNGTMSFVGPRPDVPGYADKLKAEDRKILKLKPGITGPASLKYSNEEELLAKVEDPVKYNDEVIYPDKVKINREYYDNFNLLYDIKIIFQTIFG